VWSVARRPRWIAAFVLALVIAAVFAALGQWQVGRAVQTAKVVTYPTETVIPLSSVAKPQHPVTDRAAGQMVSVVGTRVPGDTYVVSDRVNYGVTGYWVIGHVVDNHGVSLAVALGWAPTKAKADAAAATLRAGAPEAKVVGRYQPTEPPDQENFQKGIRNAVSVPELINEWKVVTKTVYGGYLVEKTPSAGLAAIYSPKPANDVTLDWLNVFYAIEWVVFAGFAVYLWYRLVKDAWEKEQEDREREAAEQPSTSDENSVKVN
jgi:cytochrome oxidase assembly protein ShyY1